MVRAEMPSAAASRLNSASQAGKPAPLEHGAADAPCAASIKNAATPATSRTRMRFPCR